LIESGFEIVLSLDGNENMRCGRIAKALLNLGLSETSQLFSDKAAPAIFHIGRNQLDAVWVSPVLVLCSVSIVPFYFEVGDYRAFIINFLYKILLESDFVPIVKPEMRRLVSC